MRIGTWNLEGRWGTRHDRLLREMDCDVLLLTEVRHDVDLSGHEMHRTAADMVDGRSWAAVATRGPARQLPDPHGASVAVEVDDSVICAGVLPWRSCGPLHPWEGASTAARTRHAVQHVLGSRPRVWGGDWNHALSGPELAGSRAGRDAILDVVEELALCVPTRDLPHRIEGLTSIDHVAVPREWSVTASERHDATGLSDHDAYAVEVLP